MFGDPSVTGRRKGGLAVRVAMAFLKADLMFTSKLVVTTRADRQVGPDQTASFCLLQ